MSKRIGLVLNDSLDCAPGTFGARLYDNGLHLPKAVYQLAVETNVVGDDINGFVGGPLQTFPGACANLLGWSQEEFARALAQLIELLKDHLMDTVLNPPPRRQFATGALIPPRGGNER